jgi:hypothetical protein
MQYSYPEPAATRDEDRARRMDRRHEIERALREPVIERVLLEEPANDRLWMKLLDRIRPKHSFTSYPCRLPTGDLGRTAITFLGGEWTAVCVPGPGQRTSG